MFVQAPVTTTVSTSRPARSASSFVSCHADIRIFSTTKSPRFGSRPAAGFAPQLPRTSAPAATPSKSGAFCFRPGAPFSTMYQTWITGAPALRKAAARRFTLLTTFCSLACCGAPDSANAPFSMITSFCRSWIRSAVFFGFSLFSLATVGSPLSAGGSRRSRPPPAKKSGRLAHVGLAARPDLGLHGIQRGAARNEERVPVGAAPREVADVLGDPDGAEVLARGADHPDAARAGDPDVPLLVALHPVRDALLDHTGADAVEEHAAVLKAVVRGDVVDLDERARRVVDVEQRLVR